MLHSPNSLIVKVATELRTDRARRLRDDIILASQDLLAEMGDDVLALQLIQARARTESVILPDVDIDPSTAFEIARKNRRDWANARASLVDAWRLIEFNADDLESTLDVVISGDVQNNGNSPLSFRGSTNQLRVRIAVGRANYATSRTEHVSTVVDRIRAKRNVATTDSRMGFGNCYAAKFDSCKVTASTLNLVVKVCVSRLPKSN